MNAARNDSCAPARTWPIGRVRALQVLRGAGFALAGVIHLFPLQGLAGSEALQRLYGIGVDDAALELLLRHRALLFGLLAVLLLGAIRVPAWRVPALVAGSLSAGAFLLLAGDTGRYGETLLRVIAGDLAACAGLMLAALAHLGCTRHARRD